MKKRVTKKEILNNYKNVICLGYCEIAYLLHHSEPLYCTSGAYGWNADIYELSNNTVIVTGYRPFGNIKNVARELCIEYDNAARDIICEQRLPYEVEKEQVNELLQKFVNNIVGE